MKIRRSRHKRGRSTVQHSAVQYSAVQYSAVSGNVARRGFRFLGLLFLTGDDAIWATVCCP
eukprot:4553065-Pyramimonas_sp.AAC.2